MAHAKTAEPGTQPRPSPAAGGFGKGRLLIAAAVAAGAGLVAVVLLLDTGDSSADGPTITTRDAASSERAEAPDASPLPLPERSVSEGPGATPQDAVEGFIVAEAAGDLATAWSWFSPKARETIPTASGWVSIHADAIGTVTGLDLQAIEVGPDDATATGEISRTPGLDPVSGLTAARSTFSVELARTDEGWWLDVTTLALTPLLPPDALAAEAAIQFIEDATACRVPALPLVGRLAVAEAFCEADGTHEIGSVELLDDLAVMQPLVAAYGGDVTTWARVVTITGATEATLVVGPFGDGWIPIGVMP